MNIFLHNHSSYPLPAGGGVGDAGVAAVVAEQEAAGMDVVTDGQLGQANPFWSYLAEFDGVVAGEVAELAGSWCPRPVVNAPIRYRRRAASKLFRVPISAHGQRKAVIPGPYTLARWARIEGHAYSGVEALALAFAEESAAVVPELAAAGARFIQVEEPAVLTPPADFRLLRRVCEPLWNARGQAALILTTCRGDAEPVYAQLNSVAADLLGLDVVSSPRLLPLIATAGSGLPLVLGICDGRRPEIEPAHALAECLAPVFNRYTFDDLHLQPSCGLGGLPAPIAKAKLQLLAQVRGLLHATEATANASEGLRA